MTSLEELIQCHVATTNARSWIEIFQRECTITNKIAADTVVSDTTKAKLTELHSESSNETILSFWETLIRPRTRSISSIFLQSAVATAAAFTLLTPTGVDDSASLIPDVSPYIMKNASGAPTEKALEALNTTYSLLEAGEEEDAGDFLFDKLDDAMWDGNLAFCDAVIQNIDMSRLTPNLMSAVLVMTKPLKIKLPSRIQLVEKVRAELSKIDGEVATTELLSRIS